MTRLLSFAFAACFLLFVVFTLWFLDVITQTPYIPPQTADVSYVDIMLHRKKHNPIDDFWLGTVEY